MTARPRPLDDEELDRQLADLPGVHRGAPTTLVVAVRAPSFAAAVRLVQLVAEDADAMDHHPEVHLRLRTVTFTLTSNVEHAVTQWDVELAHRILEAAGSVGARVLPPPPRVSLALHCRDAGSVRPFWAAGLAYDERTPPGGQAGLHDRAGRGPVLSFPPADLPAGRGTVGPVLEVHVAPDVAAARVQACLGAGGRLVRHDDGAPTWLLADGEGNELRVVAATGGAVHR